MACNLVLGQEAFESPTLTMLPYLLQEPEGIVQAQMRCMQFRKGLSNRNARRLCPATLIAAA